MDSKNQLEYFWITFQEERKNEMTKDDMMTEDYESAVTIVE